MRRVAVALARAVRPIDEDDVRVRVDAALRAAEECLARTSTEAAMATRTTFTTVRASPMPVEMACLVVLHVCPSVPHLTVEVVGSLLRELWAQAKVLARRPGGPAGVMPHAARALSPLLLGGRES